MTIIKQIFSNRLILVFLATVLLPLHTSASQRPNFLVITVDDLKRVIGVLADRPGNLLNQLYPDPDVRASIKAVLSPNIDRLAANGILFTNAYAVAPVCNPSRISLATGTRPDLSGLASNSVLFREHANGASLITMQQNLRNNGYFSTGIGKIFHKSKVILSADKQSIVADWPDTQYSWDVWMNRSVGAAGNITYSPYSSSNGAIRFGTVDKRINQQNDYLNARFIADLLDDGSSLFNDDVYNQDVLVTLPTDAPFYLGLGIYLPHQPFAAPAEIVSLFDPAQMQIDASSLQSIQDDLLDLSPGGKFVSGADGQITTEFQKLLQRGQELEGPEGELAAWKAVIQHYLAAVAVADRSVGVALDALADSAYSDNTVVILHSDHGFNLGEKNRLGKNDVWDESTGSVLIMSSPGTEPAVVENSVSLQDIYPTITSLANVELPPNVLGNDLSGYFTNASLPWSKPNFTTQGSSANRHALRTNHYRYVRFFDDPGNAELYDLRNDPDELVNLIDDVDYQNVRAALNTLLDNVRANGVSSPVLVQLDDQYTDRVNNADTTTRVQAWQAQGELVSFTAVDLPDGVEIDSQTGVITGRPMINGDFYPVITATSASGQTTMGFIWSVIGGDENAPVWADADLQVTAITSETVELAWSGATNSAFIAEYEITVETSGMPTQTRRVDGSPAVVDGLLPQTQYQITVQLVAYDGSASIDGPWVTVETSTAPVVIDTNPPYWPTELIEETETLADSVTVSWSEAEDDTGVVAYSAVLDGQSLGIINDSFLVLENLIPGTTYVLEIAALDSAGNTSVDSLRLEITLEELPPLIYFSTLSSATIPGLASPFDDATVYSFNGSEYAKSASASDMSLVSEADIDALAVLSKNHWYLSFNRNITVPGIGPVLDRDIIEYRDGEWSTYLSGSDMGLTISAHDIDALSLYNNTLYFSINGSVFVSGPGVVDDADILEWTGTEIRTVWDASDNGLPANADINGLQVLSDNRFLMSFNATDTVIPDIGAVQDEDIVEFNNGVWSVYFDGTANGLIRGGHEIDGLAVGYGEAPPPVTDTTPPVWSDTQALVLSVTTDSVQLMWPDAQDDTGVTEYKVLYTDGTTPIVLTSTDTTLTVSDLTPATTYTFEVQAVDAAANVGRGGPEITATTEALVEIPSIDFYFSTLGNSAISSIAGSADDANVYGWDGTTYSLLWGALDNELTTGADIDALSVISDTHFYVSFAASRTLLPDLGYVFDEDVIEYDNGQWSLFFDGSTLGLTAGGHDIDALSVIGDTMYFSTIGNSALPGLSAPDDADIYSWNGDIFSRVWDASAHGLPSYADIDALAVGVDERFVMSFNSSSTTISGFGQVADESLVRFQNGAWTLYFDGSAEGLTSGGHDIDAFSQSLNSNTCINGLEHECLAYVN